MDTSSSGAPLFGSSGGGGSSSSAAGGAADGSSRTINLDDIFADCFFGPIGEPIPSTSAPRPPPLPPQRSSADPSAGAASRPAGAAGGGGGGNSSYGGGGGAYDDDDEDEGSESDGEGGKRKRPQLRHMSEQQKVERRERNREHAKRSRVRKKFLLESLQQSVNALQQENEKLRGAIKDHLGPPADELLASCATKSQSLIASNPSDATRILDDPDYSLVKALQTAQQNFVITDPSLPDNPIVFASGGFLTLTGYTLDQVLGRNCRFLQGPQTDPRAVAKIRQAIADGYDASVCLLNYKIDGSTFWNQFFVAPLRDSEGNVVNYVGVQCKVSDDFARAIATSDTGGPSDA